MNYNCKFDNYNLIINIILLIFYLIKHWINREVGINWILNSFLKENK